MSRKGRSQETVRKQSRESMSSEPGQSTLDSHFGDRNVHSFEETLSVIEKRLGLLASQEYIEKRFEEMVTEKILRQVNRELKEEIMTEIEGIKETVTSLRNHISDMETSIEKLERKNESLGKENVEIKRQLEQREAVLKKNEIEINELEQYSRKNNIRIYGVEDRTPRETSEETAQKVIGVLNDKLNMGLGQQDIDIAHRIGRFSTEGNRPIICRFVSRANTLRSIKRRRALKGTQLVIREDLTQKNIKLLEKTSAVTGVKTAWSDQGKVYALMGDGRRMEVTHTTDLSSLVVGQ